MSRKSCSASYASLRSCCTSRSNCFSSSSCALFARDSPTPSTATTSNELRRMRQKSALLRICNAGPSAASLPRASDLPHLNAVNSRAAGKCTRASTPESGDVEKGYRFYSSLPTFPAVPRAWHRRRATLCPSSLASLSLAARDPRAGAREHPGDRRDGQAEDDREGRGEAQRDQRDDERQDAGQRGLEEG